MHTFLNAREAWPAGHADLALPESLPEFHLRVRHELSETLNV